MSAAAATPRVGSGGFTGSDITAWCETCKDWVVASNGGRCLWCDARLYTHLVQRTCEGCGEDYQPKRTSQRYCTLNCAGRATSNARRRGRLPRVEAMGEQEIRRAHRRYMNGTSLLDIAFEHAPHDYHGYRTATDLSRALRAAFRQRGLHVRDRRGGAIARHARAKAAT